MNNLPPPCLLCDSRRADLLDELRVEELARLWAMDGTPLSEHTLSKLRVSDPAQLYRCCQCGLEYFNPVLAGDGKFYEEIASTHYYPGVRPEFATAVAWAKDHNIRRVLDVGCGAGGFLDLVKSAGYETFGSELSEASRSSSRRKGHQVFEEPVEALDAERTGGQFDLITLFHVVEHLPNPKQVLRAAVELCSSEGFVLVAVPFADGICRFTPWIPQQWPPHHLSRWGTRQLEQLGEASGLRLVNQTVDPIRGSELRHFLNEHRRRGRELGRAVSGLSHVALGTGSYIATALARARLPLRWGTNVVAIFQPAAQ